MRGRHSGYDSKYRSPQVWTILVIGMDGGLEMFEVCILGYIKVWH